MLEKKLSSDSENLVMKMSRSCRIWKHTITRCPVKREFSYWHWKNHLYLKRRGIFLFLISSRDGNSFIRMLKSIPSLAVQDMTRQGKNRHLRKLSNSSQNLFPQFSYLNEWGTLHQCYCTHPFTL